MPDQSSKSENKGDENRVARDYAIMRLEFIEISDFNGYNESDIKALAEEFHSAQKRIILSLATQAERKAEYQVTVQFETLMRGILARLRKTDVKSSQVESTSSNLAKLPKIIIKPFDSKLENWLSFKELFDSLIHKRDLPNVEKLHYLLSSVTGPAYDLIKNFPLGNESYMSAYEALSRHYDKKRQIVVAYYERLLNCDSVKNKTSAELERVLRTFNENLSVLQKYTLPTKDFMLFHLLLSKLDSATREAFELQLDSNVNIPLYKDLTAFVEKRCRALENCTKIPVASSSKPVIAKPKSSFVVPGLEQCVVCSVAGHTASGCTTFLKMSPNERFSFVKGKQLCILCLRPSHSVKKCRLKERCEKCNFSHHTLLHFEKFEEPVVSEPQPVTSQTALTAYTPHNDALFSTAVVLMKNKHNQFERVRILLDSASACSFITRSCAHRLGLQVINKFQQSVHGIGQVATKTLGSIIGDLIPHNRDFSNKIRLEASVLPQICPDMPAGLIDISSWQYIKGLDLADPEFWKPGPIDMLVSVNILASALRPGLVKGGSGQPIAVHTVFGWILMGECTFDSNVCRSKKNCFFVSNLSLDNSLKRFWELETVDPPKNLVLSKKELACETYMQSCRSRNSEGRLIVPLTFVDPQNKPSFVNSRQIAQKRFHNLERKFRVSPQFRSAYVAFMEDYLKSGHMEEVAPPSTKVGNFYYIPHHGVLRPDSATTPLRTVFDASATDSEGKSLNESLLPGPKLQKNIFDLLMRFHWHSVVFTGDIKQMYRQFLVLPEDTDYQRILWRPSEDLPVRDYRLLTVTYGVSCAPYQALWCISQLAKDFSGCASLGSMILERDTYVDDVVTGADSVETAIRIRKELVTILSSGGLHLRKWTSNCEDFFEGLPSSDLYSEQFHNFEDIHDVSLKILGMTWLPRDDRLTFKTSSFDGRCTKRSILSDIARIFDLLGLLSPVVFLAKYIMQLLWLSGVGWDDDAPEAVSQEWLRLKTQLSLLSSLSIHRRMLPNFVALQFHGFCDASERGYCAVVYCRAICEDQSVVVRLCCAKSKVAPLRKRSIPRLELLSALLLADLMSSVALSLEGIHRIEHIVAWSDSSVALTWIKSCPSRWKTFVANRVTEIQDKVPPDCWRHVSTYDNPADHGSRGLLPADLVACQSWWAGPHWLSRPQEDWPHPSVLFDDVALDEQRILTLVAAGDSNFLEELLMRYSSFRRIVNVLSFVFRFVHNSRNPTKRLSGNSLSCTESSDVVHFLVRHVQKRVFATEIRSLVQKSPNALPKAMRKLCPFVETSGLLRVGGRLSRSHLDYEKKHPLLLPRDHRLTTLIIEDYHRRFLHPGLQTLQNLLAQEFWILSPKRAIRAVISNCIKCFRVNPRVAAPPLMGDLPSFRVSQLKPFSSAAVDFAGPFDIALGRGRGVRTFKGYVCVFVCTVTKAVHLELATELTSEAYLACLRRFIARRGRCSRLVSDQGRNFVGASNLMKNIIDRATHAEQVEFVFNPPGSPHFSGLAEAGVKSMKTHLTRVVGLQRLTYEEFYTLLTQIESVLNSRPLSPLSADPNDCSVLTPGHFLTLEPLTTLPEENFIEKKVSVLHRWQLLQQMHQHFWRRWHLEYIHTLQQRQKWSEIQKNITIGTLVLIVNEQTSPLKWNLARVTQLHVGADGVCRVVTVRSATGEYKRGVTKLCPLPITA